MNQRMKWDAEAAFKSLNAQGKRRQASIDDERLKTTPYTPPPNVAAWLKAQADKPKPRDYDAILRAAKKPPVGYYEDAPTGIKFTGVGNGSCPKIDATASKQGVAPLAPTHSTPPQSAEGGQPLPSAVTKPHGKDVDTANGPWPKYEMAPGSSNLRIYYADGHNDYFRWNGTRECPEAEGFPATGPSVSQSVALQWLEQNGHADVAAQLRGKGTTPPRDDVAMGGGRVWKDKYNGWHGVWLNGRSFGRSATCAMFEDITASRDLPKDTSAYEVELHGPERDAIVAECRKAMGL